MKIVVCIPRYGDTKGDFTISLARMLIHTLDSPARYEIEVFSTSSSDLPGNRTRLLERAIEWEARYLLWLDTDHVFPRDTLLRLLAHGLPVIGCNQARRTDPTGPVAVRINAQGAHEYVWTTAEKAGSDLVEEVAHVGLAVCLMDMRVLERVKDHLAAQGLGLADWRPFDRKLLPGTAEPMGEDTSFFLALREAGVAVHIDHGLSWQIGHIGERLFTNADAEAQKDAWLGKGTAFRN